MVHQIFNFLFISSIILSLSSPSMAWNPLEYLYKSTTLNNSVTVSSTPSTAESFYHENDQSNKLFTTELPASSTQEPTTSPSTVPSTTLFKILSTTQLPVSEASEVPEVEPSPSSEPDLRDSKLDGPSEKELYEPSSTPPPPPTTTTTTTTTTAPTTTPSTTTTPPPDTSSTTVATTLASVSTTTGEPVDGSFMGTIDEVKNSSESMPVPKGSGKESRDLPPFFLDGSSVLISNSSSMHSSNGSESSNIPENATVTSLQGNENPTPNITSLENIKSDVNSSMMTDDKPKATETSLANRDSQPSSRQVTEVESEYEEPLAPNATQNATTESASVKVNITRTTSTPSTTTLPVEESTAKRVNTSGVNPIGSSGLLSVIALSILILEICS